MPARNREQFVAADRRDRAFGQAPAHDEVGLVLLFLDARGLAARGRDLLVQPGDGDIDRAFLRGEFTDGILGALVQRAETCAGFLDSVLIVHQRLDGLRTRDRELRAALPSRKDRSLLVERLLAGGAFGFVRQEVLAAGAFFLLEQRGLFGTQRGGPGGQRRECLLVFDAAILQVEQRLPDGSPLSLDRVERFAMTAGGRPPGRLPAP